MSTPGIPDPSQQPITAADPRVQQILAMIQAKAAQTPVATAPDPSQSVVPSAPPPPVPTQLGGPTLQAQLPQNPGPPPPVAAPMASQPPSLPAPAQPNVAPTQPGPIKSFLQQLVSGLGGAAYAGTQGALQRLGIPTDYEKEQNALKIGLQQQQQNSLEGLRQTQADLYSGKLDQLTQLTAPYTIDKDDQSVLPQFRGSSTTFGGYQALQKLSGQTQGKTDVATINAQSGTVPMTPEFAQRLGVPQLAGQPVTAKALASYSKLLSGAGLSVTDIGGRSVVFDKSQVNTPNHGIIQDLAPSTKMLQAAIYANNRTTQVVDPNDPNSTIMMSPAQANALHAQGTQSIGYQTDKALQKYFTSGQGGANLTAFHTATAHLDLLQSLTGALNNGDTQLVNKYGNAFAKQTGSVAPTNFAAAKTAVAGEIAKVFKGVATEGEIASINSEINDAQSPAQLYGVINTNKTLMQGKVNALRDQYNAGKQGQPNFVSPPAAPGTPSPGGWAAKFGGVLVKP